MSEEEIYIRRKVSNKNTEAELNNFQTKAGTSRRYNGRCERGFAVEMARNYRRRAERNSVYTHLRWSRDHTT